MTTQHTEPDENETAVRATLLRLGARPAGHAPVDAEQQPAPAVGRQPAPVAVVVPPRPEHPPIIPAPARRQGSQPRVPDWWIDDKPALAVDDEQPEQQDPQQADGDPLEADPRFGLLKILKKGRAARSEQQTGADDDDQDDVPDDGISERTDRPGRRRVSKEPAADQGEESEEGADEIRRVGEGRGRRFRLPVKEASQRPRFSTPVFPREEKEKKSLAQAWRETRPDLKFALYNLTGLAGGLLFGVVGYATEVTRSVADSPLPLRDNVDAYFWGAGAVLVLAADRATRKWSWLVGWCMRGITVSVLVGALLHGNTVGEAIANMPTLLDHLSDQP
ncbi:hypothetical protein ABTX60_06880 [Streptomyces sp. NPDC126510]|uniref:hypothetical protein n=1 Tax=Streptomyces sp. NPDC126510 TaxID=3155317 RepID=UPI00332EEA67